MTKPATAALLFTGTELLRGKQNTYTPLLAAKLLPLGLPPAAAVTLPDDRKAIAAALKNALKEHALTVVVGGLGPTFDDLSREAASDALKLPLHQHPEALRAIEERFRKLGRVMTENNKRQAYLLKGATLLENPNGTAPGQFFVRGTGAKKRALALLPGPQKEWEPMFAAVVEPLIKKHFPPCGAQYSVRMALAGIGESAAEEKIRPVLDRHPATEFTILSAPGEVRLFASGTERDPETARHLGAKISAEFRAAIGEAVYSDSGEPLPAVIGTLLRRRGWMLATAESCTGGMVSDRITAVPGSSDYFAGGVVAYANELKVKVLGVKPVTLMKHGAVSSECALEMALGARKRLEADCAVSITGIAGPGGGSAEKPVGLVYIAVSVKGRLPVCKRFNFSGSRDSIKAYSSASAFTLLYQELKSI
ncbi:MAG: CinA family nicotinamide mononucleotide deamidase-related protein [Elusimicrobia bacterium]|nr:CinA family nicotinamide mononucleotide deamidase-related protein [Elusimicrobiota bacterium]